MSWTKSGNRIVRASSDAVVVRSSTGAASRHGSEVLPLPPDTRERLTTFYRERDEADAGRCACGAQKTRGQVWATALRRLETGQEVYESYGVLSSAGIDLPAAAVAMLEELAQDWRQICLIDTDGVVRTASLKQRIRSGR